jgi:hypothetical protein
MPAPIPLPAPLIRMVLGGMARSLSLAGAELTCTKVQRPG